MIVMTRKVYRNKALRAELRSKYPDAKIIVSRATSETVCTKCLDEPRLKGQRWGRNCKNAYNRKWSKKNTRARQAMRRMRAEHFPRAE
jgi:NADH pyrophosphatase NudC (nudix superfamily)